MVAKSEVEGTLSNEATFSRVFTQRPGYIKSKYILNKSARLSIRWVKSPGYEVCEFIIHSM